MTSWSEGYVSDIPYALGFYRETVPAHLAFSAICVGRHPSLSARPKRILELGIGMGLGFVINAAANPSAHFEGVDFNPLHIAHASGFVEDAELTNVSLREASFQDLAREAQEGQHDLDLIVLHGILTWVSAEAHEAIVEIARKRLKPGGLLYVSYNCMPGWAPVLPMQRLMRENAKRVAGQSDMQTRSGIELVKALISEGASYFAVNPGLAQRIERMGSSNNNYLAHEYLNANWFIFHFADVAEMFGRAKLSFLGSATIVENIDALAAPAGVRARLAAETDVIFKETLRDIAGNKQFRRDIFARGVRATNPYEQAALLNDLEFALIVPRSKVVFKFPSPLGELEGKEDVYAPIADLLAEGPASFSTIAALPAFQRPAGSIDNNAALQAISLFVHGGQVLPLPAGESADPAAAQRLNRVIARKALQGQNYPFLAVTVAGSGVQVTNVELMMLSAVFDGKQDLERIADVLFGTMRKLGISWIEDGKPMNDEAEAKARARREAETFIEEKLPLWRRLGVI